MKANVGTIDRGLRIGVGIALIAGAASGVLGVWAWIGILPLLTGVVKICPLYSILSISTCGTK